MLAGCCLLQGGTLGIIHNCRGIFYTPIIDDLGFGMGAFSFYVLFFGLCSCLILPFVSRMFSRFDTRLLLGGASIVFSGSVLAMGFFNSLPAFYIAGGIQGLSSAFIMFYPAPLILGNWFKKKAGLAIGISAAFAGLAGVIGNPMGSAVIVRFGWRVGFWFMGGLALLMTVPVSLFLLRLRPEDCGMEPYGCHEGSCPVPQADTYKGIPADIAKRSPYFWVLIFCGLLAANTCCYYAHFSPLGTYAGYGVSAAALLVSFSMAGNVVSKIVLGQVHDRCGLNASLLAGTVCTLIGFFLLLVHSYAVRLVGAFLYGPSMAMSAIMIAIAIKDVYGRESYQELLPYSSMASTFGTSFMMMIVGYIVDGLGPDKGYTVSLLIGAGITALMGVLLIVSLRGSRRLAQRCGNTEIR